MPTDVSEPIWACDLCDATFGARIERAQLCEQAAVPDVLPVGTPLLHADDGPLRLLPMAATGVIETDVSYRDSPGHHRLYQVDAGRRSWSQSSKHLHPGTAGSVQIDTGSVLHLGDKQATGAGRLSLEHLYEAIGLGQEGSPARTGTAPTLHGWDSRYVTVRPITPEVRAVFDALGVYPERGSGFAEQQERDRFLLEQAGALRHRANGLIRTVDPAAVSAEIAALQSAWFAGENVVAPPPWLEARSSITPSRIPKALRPLIDATCVEWEPRTSASEYARHIVRRLLMDETQADIRLFGDHRVIAVGGVKGGVGKSTVAAALSAAIAEAGREVVLLDFDLDDPSLDVLLDLPGELTVSDDLTGIVPSRRAERLGVISPSQVNAAKRVLPLRWSQAESAEWLRFLQEALIIPDDAVIVLDLPAGQGPIVQQVLGQTGDRGIDVLIAVGNADPLTLPALDAALTLRIHEQRVQLVVENLGRIEGATADGSRVEVRPFGDDEQVRAIAERHRAQYAGSLPYAQAWMELARSPEVRELARLALESQEVRRG